MDFCQDESSHLIINLTLTSPQERMLEEAARRKCNREQNLRAFIKQKLQFVCAQREDIITKAKKKIKPFIVIIMCVMLGISLVMTGFVVYGKYQMNKIPNMTAAEILAYSTKDNNDAVITVGIIKDRQVSYKVY